MDFGHRKRARGGSNPLSATNNEGYPLGYPSFFFWAVPPDYGSVDRPTVRYAYMRTA